MRANPIHTPAPAMVLLGVCALSAALVGCDAPAALAPTRSAAAASVRDAADGATKQHDELTGFIDQEFTFSCLDAPIEFVVTYDWIFDWVNTPSGVSNVRSQFIVDRDVSYVVYKGETYYPSRGNIGHDDNIHYQYRPDGTYVEHGVEPDFERSDTGDRLRLNFSWHTVIEPDGTVEKATVTGNCPPA